MLQKLHTSQPSRTDEEILSEYFESDDLKYLSELYLRHSEMIYYVCLRYLKDHERSQDAVMQIFEELISKIKKQDIRDFGKWIYVVAKNHCLMALRKDQKLPIENSLENFVEFPHFSHPEENYQNKEERFVQLEDCIEVLPDKQKTTIELFYLQSKCYKEVAEETGFTLKEVKSYIQNGKRNLKNCVESSNG